MPWRCWAEYGLEWLEEPIRADDLWAYRRLRKHSPVPIALGENLHTIYRFRDFIEAEAVDIIQPNIVRVGGITPFRRIVELARTNSIRVMPHLLPELSGQLALTLAEAHAGGGRRRRFLRAARHPGRPVPGTVQQQQGHT